MPHKIGKHVTTVKCFGKGYTITTSHIRPRSIPVRLRPGSQSLKHHQIHSNQVAIITCVQGCFRGGGSFQGNRLLPPHLLYPSSAMDLGKVYGLKTGSERRKLFHKSMCFISISLNLIRCLSRYRGMRKKAVSNRQLCCRVWMNHPCNTFKTEATFVPKNWQ